MRRVRKRLQKTLREFSYASMQGIGGALVAVHPKDLEDSCDQDYRRQCPLEAGRN